MDVQLGTISENARIDDCYRYAKFHACFKKVHNLPKISSYAAGLLDKNTVLTCFLFLKYI